MMADVCSQVLFVSMRASCGGDGSMAAPFSSLVVARDAIRKLRNSYTGKVTVKLLPGDYELSDTFELDSHDFGIEFIGSESTRITLSEAIKPGNVVDGEFPDEPLNETFAAIVSHPPLFFYDHKWAVPARWPKKGWVTFNEVVDSGLRGVMLNGIKPDDPTEPGSFKFDSDRPAQWNFDDGIYLAGFMTHDWAFERIKLAGYDAGTNTMHLAGPAEYGLGGPSWSEFGGRRFYVYNVRSELSEIGEYFFDRKTRHVDFIAPEGMCEFRAATKSAPVIHMAKAHNITFTGISFEYAAGNCFVIDDSVDIVVDNCRISNIGNSGILISGGANCRVVNSVIHGCGIHGVVVSGGNRQRLINSGHVVENNDIYAYGQVRLTYGVGIIVSGCGNVVRSNKIHDAPHMAITYSGNEQLIDGNEIWEILREVGDAGAIYSGRDPTSCGNIVRGNYIHDIGRRGGQAANTMAIYLDDCDVGDTVEGNRIVNVARGLLLGGGQWNRIANNTFEECDLGMSVDARGTTWAIPHWDNPKHPSWQMTRKIQEMHVDQEPWASKYPYLKNYLNDSPREPRHIEICDNRFVRCKSVIQYESGADQFKDIIGFHDNTEV